jgi:hypothetical protein
MFIPVHKLRTNMHDANGRIDPEWLDGATLYHLPPLSLINRSDVMNTHRRHTSVSKRVMHGEANSLWCSRRKITPHCLKPGEMDPTQKRPLATLLVYFNVN